MNHINVVRYFHTWRESHKIETKPARIRTESTVEREKDESLLRLDGNNFDFGSAYIDNVSWSTSSDDSDQSEGVNKARQSEDYTTSDSQSVSDIPKKKIYQSDDSFTFDRRSGDEDDQSDDEESTESENGIMELNSLESSDSDLNNRSYLFLLMEYCSNRTLKDEIYISDLDDESARSLVRDMLNGLSYLHGLNTIHRDLKPGNIFLDSQGRAKIGDFGLATEIQNRFKIVRNEVSGNENQADNSTVTRAGGTALYMAPESKIDSQTSGKNKIKVTSKVDMYAMGIIIFEMYCKIYCKMKDDRERLIFINDLKKKDKLPNGFEDPNVASIIRCLINPEPGKRYSAPELLNDPRFLPSQSHLVQDIRQFREMLRLSCTTFGTPQHEAIVQELFSVQNRTDYSDYFTYVAPTQDDSEHKSNKISILILGIFMSRGFLLNEQPVLIPVESESSNENEVKFIDTSGLKVKLPHWSNRFNQSEIGQLDQSENRKTVSKIKLYESEGPKTHPCQTTLIRADILTNQSASRPSILNLVEIISSSIKLLPFLEPDVKLEIHLNHGILINQIMQTFKIDLASQKRMKFELEKMSPPKNFDYSKKIIRFEHDNSFRNLIQKYVPKISSDDLRVFSHTDSSRIDRFKLLFKNQNQENFEILTKKIENLTKLITEILTEHKDKFSPNVILRPAMTSLKFSTGFYFQLVARHTNLTNQKMATVVADGGDTDSSTGIDFYPTNLISYIQSSGLTNIRLREPKVLIVSANQNQEIANIIVTLEKDDITVQTIVENGNQSIRSLRNDINIIMYTMRVYVVKISVIEING